MERRRCSTRRIAVPADRPHYIRHARNPWRPHPFLQGASTHGFVFRADGDALQALCARCLNVAPPGRFEYRPLLPAVLLSFTALGRSVPGVSLYTGSRGIDEYELTIWVAVREQRTGECFLFAPYIFGDNPQSVPQGREIYGAPKEMARFPQWDDDHFEVQAYTLRASAPCPVEEYCPVILLQAESDRSHAPLDWPSFDEAAQRLRRAFGETRNFAGDDVARMLTSFVPPNGPIVFLKQFPAAEDSRYACYQAIVRSIIDVRSIRAGRHLPGTYTLTLPACDTLPVARDLGLESGARPVLQYWLEFDFTCRAVATLWQADVGT